ncbi:MAG: response regulator [Candidatus Hydrogenedentes bacterium]|nr:response regulator [Candidatus Hydrogenedentota bacterium]
MTRLLVVDDNEQNRYLLQALLVGHGYEVQVAVEGAEALEIARTTPPNLIVTDILMPGMDGYSLCRHWKNDATLKSIPFVFYTATYTDAKDEEFALGLGADRFIIKPQEPEALLGIIEEVISDHEAGRLGPPRESALEETAYVKGYNEALIRKLEDKLMQLEITKASLEREVAERRRAEEDALRAGREWQRTFDATNSAMWILDLEQRIVRSNKTSERFFPYSCDELIGKHCWEVVHNSDRPIVGCPTQRVRESLRRESMEHQTERGWFEITVDPVLDKEGRFAGSIHIVSDITERKRTHEALATHSRRVQALIDLQQLSHAPADQVLDFAIDAFMSVTQSEHAFVGILSEDEKSMVIQRCSKGAFNVDGIPVESEHCAVEFWENSVRERKPILCNTTTAPGAGALEVDSGNAEITRYVAVPAIEMGRVTAVAIVANKKSNYTETDVTAISTLLYKMWEILSRQRRDREREELEEQYRQAQKMEAIGQLAGGVAHDFNNILQAILGYGSLLRDRLPSDGEASEFTDEILQATQRASTLTRQLLAFSRRQILTIEDLDLSSVINGMIKMLRRVIGEDIEVNVSHGPELGVVHADRGQMEQVLLNLCLNARDAMPEGGVISIETESVTIDEEYCNAHAWASPGRFVLLSVTDTGCGMSAETQARIFEPFFTTKDLGKGTGLGLATVYGIVRQHQGMIQVYSEVGKGSRFKVYLPSFDQTVTKSLKSEVLEPARGGSETILVAEDEEMLQRLAVRILESAGFTVLLATNGEEAVEIFEKHADKIDLAFLDVVMPKMSGKAVYDALRARFPRLRFLFSSGYSTSVIHTDFVLKEGIELIEKPYSPTALVRKVREILDRE